jgi:hypothetical protein
VTAEHAAVIAANADALVAFGPEIAKGFYDTLYGHGPTEEIFHEGERPMREQTLIGWWERTARGPIDDDYWAWMAMVGLTHVVRRVTNPMMLAMADYVAEFVSTNSYRLQLSQGDRTRLVEGFERVASMTRSVITYGYDHAMSASLNERAGIPEALLARLGDQTSGMRWSTPSQSSVSETRGRHFHVTRSPCQRDAACHWAGRDHGSRHVLVGPCDGVDPCRPGTSDARGTPAHRERSLRGTRCNRVG